MLLNILKGIFSAIVAILKLPFFLLCCAAILFFLLYLVQVLYLRAKGHAMPKGRRIKIK